MWIRSKCPSHLLNEVRRDRSSLWQAAIGLEALHGAAHVRAGDAVRAAVVVAERDQVALSRCHVGAGCGGRSAEAAASPVLPPFLEQAAFLDLALDLIL